MAPTEDPEIKIKRVSEVHTSDPFVLKRYMQNKEAVQLGDAQASISYLIGLVPLDCIDDITKAAVYNPRHPRANHRDELMDQIGTYGLIQPLVATLERRPPDDQSPRILFLIDGRHRYHGLLELDQVLRNDIMEKAKRMEERKDAESLSDISSLSPPRRRSIEIVNFYRPATEKLDHGRPGAPLIPIKIYRDQDEVERIGMAVFLNRGQKKLSGGEEIDKIYKAFEEALSQERRNADNPSERAAVERVAKGQNTDSELVVLSQHVARIMNDEESPWYDLIGRFQGEMADDPGEERKKPLTAKNFMSFVQKIVNDVPLEKIEEKQRDDEISNLNRLGNIFARYFGWPEDIPTHDKPYTATALLCRSFLILTVGIVLNDLHAVRGTKLMSLVLIRDSVWERLVKGVRRLHAELEAQSAIRVEFETRKYEFATENPRGADRQKLLLEIDRLRGRLWSLDTIIPTLRGRLEPLLGPD